MLRGKCICILVLFSVHKGRLIMVIFKKSFIRKHSNNFTEGGITGRTPTILGGSRSTNGHGLRSYRCRVYYDVDSVRYSKECFIDKDLCYGVHECRVYYDMGNPKRAVVKLEIGNSVGRKWRVFALKIIGVAIVIAILYSTML